MPHIDTGQLIRRLIGGDPATAADLRVAARTSADPRLLAAAALLSATPSALLIQARDAATSTRDRQLVALVAAHLAGDADRAGGLVRDHLADHPDDLLAAWVASLAPTTNHFPGTEKS